MKKTPVNTTVAPSLARLAALLNLSRSALADYAARGDFPARTVAGYRVAECREYLAAARATRGVKTDADKQDDAVLLELRKEKLRAQIRLGKTECALLDVKIATAKAAQMTRVEYRRDMAALLQILANGYAEAVLVVKKHCGDSAVVSGAGACFASALVSMQTHASREVAAP